MKKESILLFVANSLQTIGSIIVFGYLARNVTPELYGKFRETFLLFDILSGFIGFGSPQALYYYWNKKNSVHLLNSLFSIILTLTLICTGFALLLVFLFDAVAFSITIGLLYGLILNLIILHNNILVINQRFKTLIVTNLTWIVSLILLNIIYLNISLKTTYIGLSFIRILPSLSLLIVLFFINKKNWTKLFFYLNKGMLKYMYPLGLSILIGGASYNIDRIIIYFKENSQVYGYYINGAFEIPFVGVFITTISTILMKNLKVDSLNINKNKSYNLIKSTLELTYPIMIFLTTFCLIYSEEIMVIIFGEIGKKSHLFFLGYSLLYIVRVITYNNILISFDKEKLIPVRAISELILNILISLLLYPFYGPISVVIGTVASISLFTVPFNWFLIKNYLNVSVIELFPVKKIIESSFLSLIYISINFFYKLNFWFGLSLLLISVLYVVKKNKIK